MKKVMPSAKFGHWTDPFDKSFDRSKSFDRFAS